MCPFMQLISLIFAGLIRQSLSYSFFFKTAISNLSDCQKEEAALSKSWENKAQHSEPPLGKHFQNRTNKIGEILPWTYSFLFVCLFLRGVLRHDYPISCPLQTWGLMCFFITYQWGQSLPLKKILTLIKNSHPMSLWEDEILVCIQKGPWVLLWLLTDNTCYRAGSLCRAKATKSAVSRSPKLQSQGSRSLQFT